MSLTTHRWSKALRSTHRHTLSSPVRYQGVGVHSGLSSTVHLTPYHPRSDQDLGVILLGYPLSEWKISESLWSTSLTHPKRGRVSMTEHLFAALYAAGIDDVMIEIDAEELPILDGSALEYIIPLDPTPTIQEEMIIEREPIDLPLDLHITWLESSLKTLISLPIDNVHARSPLQIDLTLELPPIKTQRATLMTIEDLYHRVIPAKTFGLLSDEEALRSRGLIKGVSYENTRVYDDTGEPLTPSMISSEAAYHKILDIIGDLYLLSRRPRGSLEVIRGSHRLNHKALYFIKPS